VPAKIFLRLDPVGRLTVPHDRVNRLEAGAGETVFIRQLAVHLEDGVGFIRDLTASQPMDHNIILP